MEIFVTRFNSETIKENREWCERNNTFGCIYGSPIKITESLLPETDIIVIEMNNTKNIIEGIGILKNKLEREDRKKYKIYSDNNYNRFIYKSRYRIDKNSFSLSEKKNIKNLEKLLFKSYYHCKRGQGIQKIPDYITKIEDFNYVKFLNQLYISRFVSIDKTKIKIKTQ